MLWLPASYKKCHQRFLQTVFPDVCRPNKMFLSPAGWIKQVLELYLFSFSTLKYNVFLNAIFIFICRLTLYFDFLFVFFLFFLFPSHASSRYYFHPILFVVFVLLFFPTIYDFFFFSLRVAQIFLLIRFRGLPYELCSPKPFMVDVLITSLTR